MDACVEAASDQRWEELQAHILANAFTAMVPDDEQAITAVSNCEPLQDKQRKSSIATKLLRRLERQSRRLREFFPVLNDNERHVLRTVADGDFETLTELGIDTEYAWLDDVVAMLVSTSPLVEIELGPYFYTPSLKDIDGNSRIDSEKITNSEKVAILLGKIFREVLRDFNVRFIATFDDTGDRLVDGELEQGEQDRYLVNMARLLHESGALLPTDEAGKDYELITRSTQKPRVDQLIHQLQTTARGVIEVSDHEDVIFRPTNSFIRQLALKSLEREKEFSRKGILLKRHGKPTSHAIDTAPFLNPVNNHVAHLIIMDTKFVAHQDREYALLRALGIVRQDTHFNLFYDSEKLSPEVIAFVICQLLIDELKLFIRCMGFYDEWEDFDPIEYCERNYGNHILPEDRQIIEFIMNQLEQIEFPGGKIHKAIDVCAGPNLYPSMCVTPYISDQGSIELLEYSATNREYLENTIKKLPLSKQDTPWLKFEELLINLGGLKYNDTLDRIQQICRISPGSVFDLPGDAYDLVMSFFGPESITTSKREFRIAMHSLASSLHKGGVLITAHMVGSLGYPAGVDTRFPAVWLSPSEIEEAYRDAELEFVIQLTDEEETDKARDRYHGMAVVVAKKVK